MYKATLVLNAAMSVWQIMGEFDGFELGLRLGTREGVRLGTREGVRLGLPLGFSDGIELLG